MKRAWLIVGIVATIFIFISTVQANTIRLESAGGRYSNGGPFTAKVIETTPDELYGSSILISGMDGVQFTTFCLERSEMVSLYDESIAYKTVYNYSIDPYAANGGWGGQTEVGLDGAGHDYLDPRTAWLYYDYMIGHSHTYDALALQAAFWFLEDEEVSLAASNTSLFYSNAYTYIYTYAAGKTFNDIPGNYEVVVLNLWRDRPTLNGVLDVNRLGDYKEERQSQIAIREVPVPEPASMLLLGLGLIGVAVIRRKLKT